MQPAIRVDNLGKRYKIGLKERSRDNFREAVLGLATAPIRRLRSLGERVGGDDTLWALRNVSFEVQPGEVVGIIGRNGAGKTTLLKILSRITEPTEGRAQLRGRVASLLEVGTGFHPELTGRENIYLNGAILGMKKDEIRGRFDEIVDFAEIEKFLDTPVKRYSSGMYVRLAFAVAAHLEPEILIVDEVLAVGDSAFQKRCLGKMRDVAEGNGRTVLFVSHNMAAIQGLCARAIHLENGRISFLGPALEAVDEYTRAVAIESTVRLHERRDRSGDGRVRLKGLQFLEVASGQPITSIVCGRDLLIEIEYDSESDELRDVQFGLSFHDLTGHFVTVVNSSMAQGDFDRLPGRGRVYCLIPRIPLMCGEFTITCTIGLTNVIADRVEHAAVLHIEVGDYHGTGNDNTYGRQGVHIRQHWSKTPKTRDVDDRPHLPQHTRS